MSIYIKELTIKNLGPIEKIHLKFKKLNLIFGGNESGKTFLIEFLIRQLFKVKKKMVRDNVGKGKIIVNGFNDEILEFPNSNKTSLIDYIDEKVFVELGIKLTWFNYRGYSEYSQLWGKFIHEVTILDLLFNHGKASPHFMKYVNG